MTCGRKIAFGLASTLFLGLLIAWSGVIPLAASSGHWPPTEWFLRFTRQRTVKVRSSRVTVPPLDDRARVLRGAGHYDLGCRPCHGAPGTTPPPVLRHMLPHPPSLSERIPDWGPEELFWIVKHGIKLTGMPGWPSLQREDEVWDMVAFLGELTDMDRSEYRMLAGLDHPVPPDAPDVVTTCARCHGFGGDGREGAFPRLAGQSPTYLYCALKAYDEGRRFSGTMESVASALSEDEMLELARYYSGLPSHPPIEPSYEEVLPLGEEIALRGIPHQRVPSCSDCHGPTPRSRKPNYPHLAGQYASYLRAQLELFQAERRGGSPYAHLMHPVIAKLTKEQMEAVAIYYASVPDDERFFAAGGDFPRIAECGAP